MKTSRFSDTQIITILKQADGGIKVKDLCREHEISVKVSYEDQSFFRRLFKRSTGLTPSQYRRMFQPVFSASDQT